MSFLRRFLVTTLAVGGLLAAPSAAFASVSQPSAAQPSAGQRTAVTARSDPAAPDAVRKVRCTPQTFNVYHGTARTPARYAGTGAKTPRIRTVHRITTGTYWGCFVILTGKTLSFGNFHPNEIIPFPRPVELVSFELARHPGIMCPA